MPTIRLQLNDKTSNDISFKTRDELKSNTYFQKLLLDIKKEGVVLCLCYEDPARGFPKLIIASCSSKNINTLKRNSHAVQHSIDCLFHTAYDDYYDTAKEKYTSKIFFEIQENNRNNIPNHVNFADKEKAARNTYKQYCLDILSEAQAHAFNSANYSNKDEQKTLKMFSTQDFFSKINSKILNKPLTNRKSAYEALQNTVYSISTGIIQEDLPAVGNEICLREWNQNNKVFILKTVIIEDRRLQITKTSITNYGTIRTAPYVYIAVYKRVDNNALEIVRLYLYAVYHENTNICLVESNKEREYAHTLFDNNNVFIKPLREEYKTIGPQYFPNGKRPELNYRPDFLVFSSENVKIVEVCGYPNDIDYMRSFREKEAYYQTLVNTGGITYEKID